MSTTDESGARPVYRVYKRRFWGLAQLVLLNIVVSWDVGTTKLVTNRELTQILSG